jgi:hypothetical protein
VTSDGALLIADQCNNRVRRVAPDGVIETVVGDGSSSGAGDGGPARLASTFVPADVAAAPDGGFYLSDRSGANLRGGWRIRRVAADGTISTLTRVGPEPARLAALGDGTVAFKRGIPFFVDDEIRRVDPDGRVGVIIAGLGALNVATDFDGGLLIRDVGFRVRYLPPARPRRVAVAIQASSVSPERPRSLRIRLTRRATVHFVESVGSRPLRTWTGALPAGRSTITLAGRPDSGVRLLRVAARTHGRTATDRLALVIGPRLPLTIARHAVVDAYRDDRAAGAGVHVAECRRRTALSVDCAVEGDGRSGVCQRVETISRTRSGGLTMRSYSAGHDAHCHFSVTPDWDNPAQPILVPS